MSHEIVRCKSCKKVIRQCRCGCINKPTRYEICEECRNKDTSVMKDQTLEIFDEMLKALKKICDDLHVYDMSQYEDIIRRAEALKQSEVTK